MFGIKSVLDSLGELKKYLRDKLKGVLTASTVDKIVIVTFTKSADGDPVKVVSKGDGSYELLNPDDDTPFVGNL